MLKYLFLQAAIWHCANKFAKQQWPRQFCSGGEYGKYYVSAKLPGNHQSTNPIWWQFLKPLSMADLSHQGYRWVVIKKKKSSPSSLNNNYMFFYDSYEYSGRGPWRPLWPYLLLLLGVSCLGWGMASNHFWNQACNRVNGMKSKNVH